MHKLVRIALVILLSLLLASCTPKMLQPGDKIGNMEIVNYCEGNNIIDICSYLDLEKGSCIVPASWTTFWVSFGWEEPTVEELDTTWKDSRWTLTFDDHSIDLDAFGTYDLDVQDPKLGPMKARVWNICVINPPLGKHISRYDFTFVNGTRVGNHAEIWEFTIQ